ncbi:MAG: pyruvate synthase subunit PorD [Deltaproteobacteria bacterium]|nr:pyruvate synthase subunit PorD [Deltaproteobacteria bacterium]
MAKPMEQYTWEELTVGSVVTEPGNAREYKTGDWRSQRPVVEKEQCIKCAVCWIFCPEPAVYETEDGYYLANLEYCKGCGICAQECLTGCITMVEEEK